MGKFFLSIEYLIETIEALKLFYSRKVNIVFQLYSFINKPRRISLNSVKTVVLNSH